MDINMARFNLQNLKMDSVERFSNMNPKNMKDEALRKAASDFEAVFVKQLFEVMESTVEKSNFLHGGHGEDMFKSMMYDEMAKDIASNPATSFGFAEQIYQQMKDRL